MGYNIHYVAINTAIFWLSTSALAMHTSGEITYLTPQLEFHQQPQIKYREHRKSIKIPPLKETFSLKRSWTAERVKSYIKDDIEPYLDILTPRNINKLAVKHEIPLTLLQSLDKTAGNTLLGILFCCPLEVQKFMVGQNWLGGYSGPDKIMAVEKVFKLSVQKMLQTCEEYVKNKKEKYVVSFLSTSDKLDLSKQQIALCKRIDDAATAGSINLTHEDEQDIRELPDFIVPKIPPIIFQCKQKMSKCEKLKTIARTAVICSFNMEVLQAHMLEPFVKIIIPLTCFGNIISHIPIFGGLLSQLLYFPWNCISLYYKPAYTFLSLYLKPQWLCVPASFIATPILVGSSFAILLSALLPELHVHKTIAQIRKDLNRK